MSGRNKHFADEDDGRTIADMSGIRRPSLFWGCRPPKREEDLDDLSGENKADSGQGNEPDRVCMTPDERRMSALGALKAGLLVGLAYLVGLGLVILILMALWGVL